MRFNITKSLVNKWLPVLGSLRSRLILTHEFKIVVGQLPGEKVCIDRSGHKGFFRRVK